MPFISHIGKQIKLHERNLKRALAWLIVSIITSSNVTLAATPSPQDSDGDGVPNNQDNCINIANPNQPDSNQDGHGNHCDGDINNDGKTDIFDLALFKSAYRNKPGDAAFNPDADFNGDGEIGIIDLAIFKSLFGKPPGPSGAAESSNLSQAEAARFLTQTTFGPTQHDINHLVDLGNYEDWLNEQFTKPISTRQLWALETLWIKTCPKNSNGVLYKNRTDLINENIRSDITGEHLRTTVWWNTIINGQDQLRQRVAFALSEILVVSGVGPLSNTSFGLADYYDGLAAHAFGNYRDLLEAVTLHPMMGQYLSMLQNKKADPALNIRPDENFARELLQLFTIGVHKLNIDGSPKQTGGKLIPAYEQAVIEDFAKVFTGWNFKDASRWSTSLLTGDTIRPMIPWAEFHDTENEKRLLNNTVLPAGQTAMEDLQDALDNVFNHSNVGPFISKQLIQRLVTSNPSRAYVKRVALTFNDNGAGIRGDLKAVIKAILLDEEARTGHLTIAGFGKLREPLLRLSHLRRAFGVVPVTHQGTIRGETKCGRADYHLYDIPVAIPWTSFGQDILQSPSVFNFFLPDYSPPGVVRAAKLLGPEFQIVTENTAVNLANEISSEIQHSDTANFKWTTIKTNKEIALASDSNRLLDHLNLLLLNGNMSADLRRILLLHLENDVFPDGQDGLKAKVRDAIMLIVISPDYLIQK